MLIEKPGQGRQCRREQALLAVLFLAIGGCGGEPSSRELKNRQELEALLTAVSLKNAAELERDEIRINARHSLGELSSSRYDDLHAIIKKARSGDWTGAESQAYELRARRPYFR